jgi:endogenous inhibitor of DNA gyrase (YacG/DUF329 family)
MQPTQKNTRDNLVREAITSGKCPMCGRPFTTAPSGIACAGCGFYASREEISKHDPPADTEVQP